MKTMYQIFAYWLSPSSKSLFPSDHPIRLELSQTYEEWLKQHPKGYQA
jgi:hypothetical protein